MVGRLSRLNNVATDISGDGMLRQGRLGKKYLAFDLETAKVLPKDVEDLMAYRPLGISCAATLKDDELVVWHGETADKKVTAQMTQAELRELVFYLQESVSDGFTVCSWNGLGFDFDILAEESRMTGECSALALNHIDMMFHFFCLKGFAISLDKAARGMGLPGKFEAVDGALVPELWAAGQHQKVFDYLTQDVRMILGVAQAVDERRKICWTSNRGSLTEAPISNWMTAIEAVGLPEPDTSWMRDPWPRSKFVGWTAKDRKR